MPREIVVFDTNAYRAIGVRTMETIRAAERQRGICAQASESVVFELLARYASNSHRQFADSALRALVAHTTIWQFGSMIPFARSPLRRSFVPKSLSADARLFEAQLSDLLVGAFVDGRDHDQNLLQPAAERIQTFVDASEHDYGTSLFDASASAIAFAMQENTMLDERDARRESVAALRRLHPPFAAEMLALRGLETEGVPATEDALSARTIAVLREAPVAVSFTQNQIERAASGEIDPRAPKHSNSLWDMDICAFMIPDSHTRSSRIFNRAPLVVVTSEGQIENAALAVGARHLMRTLGEHCALIGLAALAEYKRWR